MSMHFEIVRRQCGGIYQLKTSMVVSVLLSINGGGGLPKKKNYSNYSLKCQNGTVLVGYFRIWIFIAFSFCICTKKIKIHTLVNIVNFKTSIFSTPKIIFFIHFMSNNQLFGWLGPLPYKNESWQSIMR